eukprot:g20855.t1
MLPADVVHLVGREGVRNAKAVHDLLVAADGHLQDFKKDRPSNLAHRGAKSSQPVEASRDRDDAGEEEGQEKQLHSKAIDFKVTLADRAKSAGVDEKTSARWAISGAKNGTASGKATLLARLNGHLGEDTDALRVRLEDSGQTEEAMVSVIEQELPGEVAGFLPSEKDLADFEQAAFDMAHAVGGCASDSEMNDDPDPLQHAQKANREEYNRKAALRTWTTRMEKVCAKLLRLKKQIAS